MLFADFLRWWYGQGWALRVRMLGDHMTNMVEYFSIGTLLKTLFSPWRQNITIARPDQSLQAKASAGVDNIISRFVGFFVRLFVLVAAVLTLILVLLFNLVYTIVWPLLPLSPIILISVGAVL